MDGSLIHFTSLPPCLLVTIYSAAKVLSDFLSCYQKQTEAKPPGTNFQTQTVLFFGSYGLSVGLGDLRLYAAR